MATYYGTQYQAAFVNNPADLINAPDRGGKVMIEYFEYVATTTIPGTGDFIKLCKIPKGARVLDVEISAPDMGTGGAINVGWAASAELDSAGTAVVAAVAAGFFAALDINTAAAQQNMADVAGAAVAGHLKLFAAEVDLQMAPSTIWTVTTGTIKGYVKYAKV